MPKFLAIDFGTSRLGLAFSEGELAIALDAIDNNEAAIGKITGEIFSRGIELVVVGFPLNLSGKSTKATDNVIEFAKLLRNQISIPLRLIDERLTTKSAAGQLRAVGFNSKSAKTLIDSQSAAVILEAALAQSKLGKLPGYSLEELDD